MNLRWKLQIFTDWTVFLWRRFPAMFTAEFRFRVWCLVGYKRIFGHWDFEWMFNRIGTLGESFASYMTVKREQALRDANPDCWGGDTYE